MVWRSPIFLATSINQHYSPFSDPPWLPIFLRVPLALSVEFITFFVEQLSPILEKEKSEAAPTTAEKWCQKSGEDFGI